MNIEIFIATKFDIEDLLQVMGDDRFGKMIDQIQEVIYLFVI